MDAIHGMLKISIHLDHHWGPRVPSDVLELTPVSPESDLIVGSCILELMCAF